MRAARELHYRELFRRGIILDGKPLTDYRLIEHVARIIDAAFPAPQPSKEAEAAALIKRYERVIDVMRRVVDAALKGTA